MLKQDYKIFEIGHDEDVACTKKPQFEYVKSQDLVYGDLVSLLDAKGEAGDYIIKLLW